MASSGSSNENSLVITSGHFPVSRCTVNFVRAADSLCFVARVSMWRYIRRGERRGGQRMCARVAFIGERHVSSAERDRARKSNHEDVLTFMLFWKSRRSRDVKVLWNRNAGEYGSRKKVREKKVPEKKSPQKNSRKNDPRIKSPLEKWSPEQSHKKRFPHERLSQFGRGDRGKVDPFENCVNNI